MKISNGWPATQEDVNQTHQAESLKCRLMEVKDGQIAKYESQREQIRAGMTDVGTLPAIAPPNLQVCYLSRFETV